LIHGNFPVRTTSSSSSSTTTFLYIVLFDLYEFVTFFFGYDDLNLFSSFFYNFFLVCGFVCCS
jgi:hypothetical protein